MTASPTPYERCSHGKLYKGEECAECDIEWAKAVTIPNARREVSLLMQFYDTDTIIALLFAQAHHVEKLQAKLRRPDEPAFRRVREG